jgi:subtilisin family serine protease/subtilisin-like proprotein convertase family protein
MFQIRRWLTRATAPRPRRAGFVLGCVPLESRLAPDAKPRLVSPFETASAFSATELVAELRSARPILDLANVTAYLGLGGAVDLARSYVVFSTGDSSFVSIGLRPGANPLSVASAFSPVSSLFTWVTPNYVYSPAFPAAAGWLERTPNDSGYPQQWHLPTVRAPVAWDTTYGSPGITVAVLDGGIDIQHPDLRSNIYVNAGEIPGDGLDNDGNGYVDDLAGWDFSTDTNDPNPDDPFTDTHGTQVAGLLAATIDNGLGVAGLAGRVTILPMKVVGSGALTSLSLARAAAYSVQAGAKVITCSINIDPLVGDPSFAATANFVYNRGVLWFNSAGNFNAANPARQSFEQFLFVSATDRGDRKASYSNYGSGIDLSAPGGDLGDGLVTTTTVAAGSYGVAFGTSMAAPLAAATAALVWSANPGLTRDQVASRVIASATDLDPFNSAYPGQLGGGRIDAGRAVRGTNLVTTLGPLTGLPAAGVPVSGTLGTLTLRLDAPLDPGTVFASNFELRGAGLDNQFGTADDTLVALRIANEGPVRVGTNELHFVTSAALTGGRYRFTARAGGLKDPFGVPVDGDNNGTAGGDFVREFGVALSAVGTVFDDVDGSGGATEGEPGLGGEEVYADLDNDGVRDGQSGSSDVDVAIPDDGLTTVVSEITIDGLTRPVRWVTATVHLSHAQPGDLRISLVSPDGTRVLLFGNRFVSPSGSGFEVTFTFDDAADGEGGFLRPDEPLGTFRGEDGNGTWRLEIVDTTPGDSGSLLGWSLDVIEEPTAVTDEFGQFTLGDMPPGSYPIRPLIGPGEYALPAAYEFEANAVTFLASVGVGRVGVVTGRVVSSAGLPVPGAVAFVDLNANGKADANEPSAVSDAGGYYTVAGVPTGPNTLRLSAPLGYDVSAPAGGSYAVNLSTTTQSSRNNDFTLAARPAPSLPTIPSVTPELRTSGVPSFDVHFNRPVDGLSLADFRLTRNGLPVPLDGATLIGSGGTFTLIGTAGPTAAEGSYRLSVSTPGTNTSTSVTWAVDLTPPAVAPPTIHRPGPNRPAQSATFVFSEPVTGVTLANLVLTRNGAPVDVTGATLAGSGTTYVLGNLTGPTTLPGEYVLAVRPGATAVTDGAGNAFAVTAGTAFTVGASPPPVQERLVAATGPGRATTVQVRNASGTVLFTLMPFGPSYTGGARVTTADVNRDGVADLVVGAGAGRSPDVRIYDGRNGVLLSAFFAFETSFTGGVNVAAADFDGDGQTELILTPDLGGGPRVRVLSPDGQTTVADFFGIEDPNFRGGARATAGDLNGDGTPDLIVAAGFGGGPRIAGYDGTTLDNTPVKLFNDFFAFEPTLRNGVFLASTDVDGDGFAELIAGGGPGGGPRVYALSGKALVADGTLVPVANFFAGNPNSRGGTVLATKDLNGDGVPDLLATDGPTIRGYLVTSLIANPGNPAVERMFNPFDGIGGVFVG